MFLTKNNISLTQIWIIFALFFINITKQECWSAFNVANITSLSNTVGYTHAVYDGQHVYFVPYHDNTNYHGKVLRYNTQSPFSSSSSWLSYDVSNSDGQNGTAGYSGGVAAGQYIYFSPYLNASGLSH